MQFTKFGPVVLFSLLSIQTQAKTKIEAVEILHTTKVSDEWRKTYHFEKAIYDLMQENLQFVMDSHELLQNSNLSATLQKELEEAQAQALKKIVNLDKKILPYLLREYANNIRETKRGREDLDRETRSAVAKALKSRHEALEAAIKSTRLSAVPFLTDLHARAVKGKANTLAKQTLKLVESITKTASVEAEQAQMQKKLREETEEPAAENPVLMREPPRAIILDEGSFDSH